jgi:hypothetical protein
MKLWTYIVVSLAFMGAIYLNVLTPGVPQEHKTAEPKDTLYTYHHDILPLLQANCNPCHFPGGKVYKKLPFDDSATVARLGKKLNTRLKKQEQQAIINGWVERGKK